MQGFLGLVGALLASAPTHVSAQALTVLSSRADTVGGGDALIAVALPKGASASAVKGTLTGAVAI